jgi:hypothetical protein
MPLLNNWCIRTFKGNYDMLRNTYQGRRGRSGEKLCCGGFIVLRKISFENKCLFLSFRKTLLLLEVPQLLDAQVITQKLFSELQGKINKALPKIQEVLNEINCTIVMCDPIKLKGKR